MSLSTTYNNIALDGSTTITLTDVSLADSTSVSYSIYGVSSSDINGAALSGDFTISSGTASFDITATADNCRLITVVCAGYDPLTIAVYDRTNGPPVTVEGASPKQILKFVEPGNHNWTVPIGVTEITAVVVGGGGGGRSSTSGGSGGGGGDLRHSSSVSVTPYEQWEILVGAGGGGGTAPTAGGMSAIRSTTAIPGDWALSAAGGGAGRANAVSDAKGGVSTAISGSVSGGDGGIGIASGSTSRTSGGGGAGGYSGNGGNSGTANDTAANSGAGGGGGGGGGSLSGLSSGSGGGVNIFGPGPDGAAGVYTGGGGTEGTAGSFGFDGQSGITNNPFSGGGMYGGGGGGSDNTTTTKHRPGAGGAVALSFPAADGVYVSNDEIYAGTSFTFVVVSNTAVDGSTVSYTITGVTSSDLNGATLTGSLTFYNKVATLNLSATIADEDSKKVLLSVTGIGSSEIIVRGFLNYFPSAYRTLISEFSGTKKYIWARTGSDSNNGDSISTAYATIQYAIDQNQVPIDAMMFIIGPGTYVAETLFVPTANASCPIVDFSRPRIIMCAPGRTEIKWRAGTQRDAPLTSFANSGSAIYGATLVRDNNGKTANYSVSFFNATTASQIGNFYNCVVREINANGNWSLQYGSCTTQVNNCTFYTTEDGLNDYSGVANLVFNDCAFNYNYGTGSAAKNNTLVNQAVDAITYEIPSQFSVGVYSGSTYWPPVTTSITITRNGSVITSAQERNTVLFTYQNTIDGTGTKTYTITGISPSDVTSGNLTGTFSLTDYRGSVSLTLTADYDFTEGTEVLTFTVDQASASLNIVDLPSSFYLSSSSVVAGVPVLVTLIVNNLPQGTLVPYTITGVSQFQINVPLQGNFVIDDNNSAELLISTGTLPGGTITLSADGNTANIVVSFTPSFVDAVTAVGIDVGTLSHLPVNTRDFVNRLIFPIRKNFREVDESTGAFVIRPLGVELTREYWI